MHALINHLIAQNPDIRQTLSRHSGRSLEMQAAGLRLRGTLDAEGYLNAGGHPETVLVFRSSAVQKVLQGQTPGVGDIDVSGDRALGMALLPLFGGLHYHADRDIGRLFGEAAAERARAAGSLLGSDWRGAREGLYAHVSEYVRHHDDTVAVHRSAFAPFAEAVETLRDDAARLEARLNRLPSRR